MLMLGSSATCDARMTVGGGGNRMVNPERRVRDELERITRWLEVRTTTKGQAGPS